MIVMIIRMKKNVERSHVQPTFTNVTIHNAFSKRIFVMETMIGKYIFMYNYIFVFNFLVFSNKYFLST